MLCVRIYGKLFLEHFKEGRAALMDGRNLFICCFVLLCFTTFTFSCGNNKEQLIKAEEAKIFKKQRDELIKENIALKAELAMRVSPSVEVVPPAKTVQELSVEKIKIEAQKTQGIQELKAGEDNATADGARVKIDAVAKKDEQASGGKEQQIVKKEAKPTVKRQVIASNYQQLRNRLAADAAAKRLYIFERGDVFSITVPGDILFHSGDINIKKQGQAVLRRIAKNIKGMENKTFRVFGHSDNTPLVGSAKQEYRDNYYLSLLRAEKVMEFLANNGVSTDYISAVGFGDTKPLKDNTDPQSRSFNRRIVIVINNR